MIASTIRDDDDDGDDDDDYYYFVDNSFPPLGSAAFLVSVLYLGSLHSISQSLYLIHYLTPI